MSRSSFILSPPNTEEFSYDPFLVFHNKEHSEKGVVCFGCKRIPKRFYEPSGHVSPVLCELCVQNPDVRMLSQASLRCTGEKNTDWTFNQERTYNLNSEKVKCALGAFGCGWKDQICRLDDHLKYYCHYRRVPCRWQLLGCEEQAAYRCHGQDIKAHETTCIFNHGNLPPEKVFELMDKAQEKRKAFNEANEKSTSQITEWVKKVNI